MTLCLLLLLGGCGWTPLYADPATGPADKELAAIKVMPIPERFGQRLEWALRTSLNPSGVPTPERYRLRVTLQTVRQDLGVITQGIATRGRFDAYAQFSLDDSSSGKPLLQGNSHVAESFDIVANEYSSTVAEDDSRVRSVEELRRDLVSRLTVFMQRRAIEGPAATAPAAAPVPPPQPMAPARPSL